MTLPLTPSPVEGEKTAGEQPDFIYFECSACGFDSVQPANFRGTDTCPVCDSDNHYSQMRKRVCLDTDKPEGRDARKDGA